MTSIRLRFVSVVIVSVAGSLTTMAQQGPPPGYYDIPKGFDFPADKKALELYRATGNLHAQRRHVWNVFAGMSQQTPDGKHAIFETWYSQDNAFSGKQQPKFLASRPRRIVRHFRVPRQFEGVTPLPFARKADGDAPVALSEVLFNHATYKHIRDNELFSRSTLEELRKSGELDRKIPKNKTIPAFPKESAALKTVWWPVKADGLTPMPVWDPETNPSFPNMPDYFNWTRVVAVDPKRTNIPPNETTTITFLKKPRRNSHVVSLGQFHYVKLDEKTVKKVMDQEHLKHFVGRVFDRQLKPGDYIVLAGTHLTTKEIDDWVWATFWWHDRPEEGPFAADRTDNVKGVWRNYLMSASYDLNLPRDPDDDGPHIAFNPWLEGVFTTGDPNNCMNCTKGGLVSNCMNCHNRAAIPPVNAPHLNSSKIYRGDPELKIDPAYKPGSLRTDFLWSIPDSFRKSR